MATATLENPNLAKERFNALFSSVEYVISHNVPILDEHERPDGTKIGRKELQAIVDENNLRIADTEDYVPLILGHTPDDDASAVPPIIGYAGPFKLAMIGNVDRRWAIVAENWAVEKNHAAAAKSHPRRSVELWFEKDSGRPKFIDPIALLGGTTPRRPLGLKLAAKRSKHMRCEAYEMVAASGSNTFPPGAVDDDDDKEKNEAGDDPEVKPDPDPVPPIDTAPTQEELLVKKILDGLEASDVFVWARQQMAQQGVAVDGNPPIPGGDDPVAGVDGDVAGDPVDNDSNGDPSPDGDGIPSEENPMADDPKKGEPDKNKLRTATLERDQYRQLAEKNGKELKLVRDQYAALKAEVDGLRKVNTLADRREKFRNYIEEGYQVDLESEVKETADLSDAEFDRYCKTVEKYCVRVPIGHQLPGAIASDKYQGDKSLEAEKKETDAIVAFATRNGINSFDEAKEKYQASRKK